MNNKVINKKTLKMIRESNEFGINDKLTRILSADSELSEEELEMVAAAAGPDYSAFKKIIEKSEQK